MLSLESVRNCKAVGKIRTALYRKLCVALSIITRSTIATRAEAFQSILLTLNTVKLLGWIRIYPYESSFVVMHTAGRSVLQVGCGLTTPVRGWRQKLSLCNHHNHTKIIKNFSYQQKKRTNKCSTGGVRCVPCLGRFVTRFLDGIHFMCSSGSRMIYLKASYIA